MLKNKSHFGLPILLIILGLIVRYYAWILLPSIKSEFTQPLILQLLSFSLPISVYIQMLLSIGSGLLLYSIGKKRSVFTGIVATGIYCFSPWYIYIDISQSIYSLGLFAVLLSIYGYIERKNLQGYKYLVAGGVLVSYTFVFGFIYHLILMVISFRKERGRLLSGIIPLVPLIFLSLYNLEGLKNILRIEFSIFNDIGIINAVNTFQGNLYEAGWGGLGKLILNKFSYYFLLLSDSILRIFSPVTYFTAERKMFGFSNLAPLSFILLVPFLFGLKHILLSQTKKSYVWVVGFFALIISVFFSAKSMQLEKLVLISPFIILLISYGLNDLKKNKTIILVITLLFVLSVLLNVFDFVSYENMRMEILQR